MRIKLVKESLETQNEGFGVLGIIGVGMLTWVGLKKLVKFLAHKSLHQVIEGTIKGLEQFKITQLGKFQEEIKVLELNDRYKISMPNGIILSVESSSKKLIIRDIFLFKETKQIVVNADNFRPLTTQLTDSEYESVVNLIQSEA